MRQRPMVIGAVAVLVLLVVWYLLLWSPRSAALDDARNDTRAAEQQAAELRGRLARLQAAQNDEARVRAQVEALRAAVPDEPSLAELILDANDAATKAGIDFLSIAPNQPVASGTPAPAAGGPLPPGLTPIPINMSVTGGYFQVLDFVNRLYSLPRLIIIDGLSVTSAPTGRLVVQITARMFTTAPPVPAPGAVTTTTAPGATTTTVAG